MIEPETGYPREQSYTSSFWLNPFSEASFGAMGNNKWVQVQYKDHEPLYFSLTSFVARYGFSYELYLADLAYERTRDRASTFATYPG